MLCKLCRSSPIFLALLGDFTKFPLCYFSICCVQMYVKENLRPPPLYNKSKTLLDNIVLHHNNRVIQKLYFIYSNRGKAIKKHYIIIPLEWAACNTIILN